MSPKGPRGRSAPYWRAFLAYYGVIERRYVPRAAVAMTVSPPIARALAQRYQRPFHLVGQPLRAAFAEPIPQALVRQLHDDHQLAVDDVIALQRQNVGMPDRLDSVEGFEFLLILYYAMQSSNS